MIAANKKVTVNRKVKATAKSGNVTIVSPTKKELDELKARLDAAEMPLTQEEYDALEVKLPDVIYQIYIEE